MMMFRFGIAMLALTALATQAVAAELDTTLRTADTVIRPEPSANGITISSLTDGKEKFQWVAPNVMALLPLADSAMVDGKQVALKWSWTKSEASGAAGKAVVLRFVCNDPKLEAISTWTTVGAGEPGPIEHELTIINRGTQEVLISHQGSLRLASVCAPEGRVLENWYVEKGIGTPSPEGVHHPAVEKGFNQMLKSTPTAADGPRDVIPWTTVHDAKAGRGWYMGIESSARVEMRLVREEGASGAVLQVDAGQPSEKDEWAKVAAGASWTVPTVFIGCYEGSVDDGCNRLRKWVQSHLQPKCKDPRYPLLVNNSWGSGMGVDERLARQMIDESADLGLELFGVDAGWFCGVGDWRPNPKKFPNGLGPVADYAHLKGLKFGVWLGWTQGGTCKPTGNYRPLSVVDEKMKGWFTEDAPANYKENEYNGMTVCLADPRAEQWCMTELRRIVKESKIDMLEHDQPMVIEECKRTDHTHSASRTDATLKASEAYYRIYETLRKENPNLIFEDCVNGGRMVDYGVAKRVDYICVTDTYDPLSNRRAVYDASYALPAAMCESYVENRQNKTKANFVAMLRSGMMGWCTIMADTHGWIGDWRVAAKRQFELYKTVLRPLVLHGDLYHVTERPDGVRWDGMEFFDASQGRGVLYAFRGTTDEAEHVYVLKGLDPQARYAVAAEDGSVEKGEFTGELLQTTGLKVKLGEKESSDLIFLLKK